MGRNIISILKDQAVSMAMLRNLDYETFLRNGMGDVYSVTGSYNLFTQCDAPEKRRFVNYLT